MPMRPRIVEPDLQGNPGISPAARPVDQFQFARDPRFSPDLTDFAGLSASLARSLANRSLADAPEQQAAGAAEYQKQLDEATKGSNDLAKQLAKSVNEGTLAEQHNPYFITGFRKAAAREIAFRWYANSAQQLEDGTQAASQPDPTTGVYPQPKSPETVQAEVLKGLLDHVKQVNPELANDPWFTQELSQERDRLGKDLLLKGTQIQGEATRAAARNQLAADFGRKLDDFAEGHFNPQEKASVEDYITKNIHGIGIKDPHAFVFGVIKSNYYHLLNTQGADSARDFVNATADLKVGPVTIASGQYGEELGGLQRAAFKTGEQDANEAAARLHNARTLALQDFQQSDIYKRVGNASRGVDADNIINEVRSQLVSNPEQLGLDKRFGGDYLQSLVSLRELVNRVTPAENDSIATAARAALSKGDSATAEALILSLPGSQQATLRAEVEKFKVVTPYVEGNPNYATLHATLMQNLRGIDGGDPEMVNQVQQHLREQIDSFAAEASDLMSKTPEADRGNVMRTFAATRGAQLNEELRRQVVEANKPVEDLEHAVREGNTSGKDMGAEIETAFKNKVIDERTHDKLAQLNYDQSKPVRAFVVNEEPYDKLGGFAKAAVLNRGNYTPVLSTGGLEGTFSRLGWARVDVNQSALGALGVGTPPTAHIQLLPEGVFAIDNLKQAVRTSMVNWFKSPEAQAAREKSPIELEARARDTFSLVNRAAMAHLLGAHPEKPFEFDPTKPSAVPPPALPQDAEQGMAPKEGAETLRDIPRASQMDALARAIAPRDWGKDSTVANPQSFYKSLPGGVTEPFAAMFGNMDSPVRDAGKIAYGQKAADDLVSAGPFAASEALDNAVKLRVEFGAFADFDAPTIAQSRLMHPYPLNMAILQAAASDRQDRMAFRAGAMKEIDTVLGRVAANTGIHDDDKEHAALNARMYAGISQKELAAGNIAGIPIRHPERIHYEVTPLFANEIELDKAADDPEQMTKLFKALSIPLKDNVDLADQTNFKNFMFYQRAAVKRIQ